MPNIWFTSDTHFCHKNVIKYSSRPFSCVEEMNEVLIQKWNERVKKNDLMYFLGDFCLAGKEKTLEIRRRLNGFIYFCRGNHDKTAEQIKDTFTWFGDVKKISPNGQPIWLSHYCHHSWPGMHDNAWHLYGHSHGSLGCPLFSKKMDVGVDTNFYQPYHFDEVAAIMKHKQFIPVDHHK